MNWYENCTRRTKYWLVHRLTTTSQCMNRPKSHYVELECVTHPTNGSINAALYPLSLMSIWADLALSQASSRERTPQLRSVAQLLTEKHATMEKRDRRRLEALKLKMDDITRSERSRQQYARTTRPAWRIAGNTTTTTTPCATSSSNTVWEQMLCIRRNSTTRTEPPYKKGRKRGQQKVARFSTKNNKRPMTRSTGTQLHWKMVKSFLCYLKKLKTYLSKHSERKVESRLHI